MTTFKVRWEIDIEANTPREAAYKALFVQRTPDSDAVVFEVQWGPLSQHIDLRDHGPVPALYFDEIESLQQAKDFLTRLHTSGKLFHPEDSPDTVIDGGTGQRIFTDEEAKLLEVRVAEVHDMFWGYDQKYGGDPTRFITDELLKIDAGDET